MHLYLVISQPQGDIEPMAELKFFEWLKHQKKTGRVTEYWAFKAKPGLAAIFKVNFPSELDELLEAWRQRVPSEFTAEPLKDPKSLETELAGKILG